jgi:hypothetical protein
MLILSTPLRGDDAQARPIAMAVADFDYTDTSGEPTNQQSEHEARLQVFSRTIRDDLASSGKYRIVTLVCGPSPCSGPADPAGFMENARRAGAKLLLYGGIHKMSTLIQNAKVQVIDIEANKLLFDRLISFRGDTDEAWQRAERFLVRELVSQDFPR